MDKDKQIPLEKIKDTLPEFEEKKEMYKLRHYLAYHVVKKRKVKQTFVINKDPIIIKFD
jgi:hypothetical protein